MSQREENTMQTETRIECRLDYNKEKTFYFTVKSDGDLWPDYCDDARGGEDCIKCAEAALKKIISEKGKELDEAATSL